MAAKRKTQSPNATAPVRRKHLIEPSFQWKYTALAATGVFMVSVFMSAILLAALYQQARAKLIDPASFSVFRATMMIAVSGASFAIFVAILFGLWSLLITHRMAGPLAVIETFYSELAAGRFPTHRRLRRKDEFTRFYQVFWSMVDALKIRKEAEADELAKAIILASEATRAGAEDRRRSLQLLTAQLQAMRADIEKSIGKEPFAVTDAPTDTTSPTSQRVKELAKSSG